MLIEEIQQICLEFKNKHRGLKTLQFKIRNTAFETYESDVINKTNKGACLPELNIVFIVAKNHITKEDVMKTLNHEVYGHIGILNLKPTEKESLLSSIKQLNTTELKKEWETINAHYEDLNEDDKAEEVFALISEEIGNVLTMTPALNANPASKKEVHNVAHYFKNKMIMGLNKPITFQKPTMKYSKGDTMPEKKPTYEEKIAREIIDALEDGTAPWVKPWKGESLRRMAPFNPTTGKTYNGINFVNLSLKTMNTGDPRWMTYKQAKAFGGQVKKGESGTTIQFWKFNEEIDKIDSKGNKVLGADGKPKKDYIRLENPKVFYATVFNGSQINNLPPLQEQLDEKELLTDFEPNVVAEKILINSGATINHKDGNRAFYASRSDEITLPHKEQFRSEAEYYGTALHELGHWTGHESRLDRNMGNSFGSILYAKEELRAEIASFMLSSQIGIDFDPKNHHSYIDSWVQVLEDTPREIFKACSDAGKITSFINNLQEQALEKKEPILDNSLTNTAKETLDKLKNSSMEIIRINSKEAEELINNYGSLQEQSPHGSTHTEIDLSEAGKLMLVQRDDNGEVHTSAALREQWNDDFFTNNETTTISKIIEDRSQMKTLQENYLLLEVRKELNSGARGNELAQYIKPLAVSTTTPIEEVNKTINWVNSNLKSRASTGGSIINTLSTLKNTLEEVYESRTFNHTLEEKLESTIERGNPYALNDGRVIMEHLVGNTVENMKSEGLYIYVGEVPMKPQVSISNEEAKTLITNDFQSHRKSFTVSEIFEKQVTSMKETDKVLGPEVPSQDDALNAIDAYADELLEGVLDEETNIKTEVELEATLEDIQNAIIYGQDELLQGGHTDHSFAIISTTVDLLKVTADKIDAELMKEPSYEKKILENHAKLQERSKIMHEKKTSQTFSKKTYLAVPYKEKDLAKKSGAKWDKEKKSWYAPEGSNMDKLKDWTIDNQEIKQMLSTSTGEVQDAISEFKEALEAQGLIINGDPIMDGELRRVKVEGDKGAKKSGAYVGYSDGYPAGMIQNYKTNYKENWKSTNGDFSNKLTPEQVVAQKALNEAKKAERIKEVEAQQEDVSKKVSTEFKEALPADITHPYLITKRVKPHGLKMDNRGNLIMPLKDINGKQWTSQKINTNFKGFEKHGKKEGCFYIIGENEPSDLKEVIIVEGFATGASISEALEKPVVVAVDSGNLSHVAQAFHEKYPSKPIIIAGDDDMQQEQKSPPKPNAGKIKSTEAAEKVKGTLVLPKFTSKEIQKGATDFNDLASSRGKNAVKIQMNVALRKVARLTQDNTKEKAPVKQKEGMSR